jgi:hypothetical protein
MLDRTVSALVALSLAFLVWLYARTRDQEVLDNVPLPVQITLAPGQAEQYSLEVPEPCQVPVSFSGPPSRIKELRGLLQRGELHVDVILKVPEDRQHDSHYLDTVRVEPADVHAPPGVAPMLVEGRNRIPVTLHHLVQRRLPVRFDYEGEERVGQVSVEPATVLVHGPEEVLDRTRAVPTQPYLIPARPEDAPAGETINAGPVALVQELEGRPIRVTPAAVSVKLALQPARKVYELDLPVQFLCPANIALRPRFEDDADGRVTISVEGPAADEPPAVLAFVDLTRRPLPAGSHEEPLRVQLPRDCQLTQGATRLIRFRLEPAGLAVHGAESPTEP